MKRERHRHVAFRALLGCLCILITTPANAQVVDINGTEAPVLFGPPCDRYLTHAYMGGQLMGIGAVAQTAIEQDRFLSRFGGGIGLFGGLRLNPYISVEGNWTFALHDEIRADLPDVDSQSIYLMTFTADLKTYLPTRSSMEPYLQAGAGLLLSGGISLDQRESELPDSFSVGATFTAGGGLDIWVTRHIAMGARVLYRGFALGVPVNEGGDVKPQVDEGSFRNYIHGISVDAMASIHF